MPLTDPFVKEFLIKKEHEEYRKDLEDEARKKILKEIATCISQNMDLKEEGEYKKLKEHILNHGFFSLKKDDKTYLRSLIVSQLCDRLFSTVELTKQEKEEAFGRLKICTYYMQEVGEGAMEEQKRKLFDAICQHADWSSIKGNFCGFNSSLKIDWQVDDMPYLLARQAILGEALQLIVNDFIRTRFKKEKSELAELTKLFSENKKYLLQAYLENIKEIKNEDIKEVIVYLRNLGFPDEDIVKTLLKTSGGEKTISRLIDNAIFSEESVFLHVINCYKTEIWSRTAELVIQNLMHRPRPGYLLPYIEHQPQTSNAQLFLVHLKLDHLITLHYDPHFSSPFTASALENFYQENQSYFQNKEFLEDVLERQVTHCCGERPIDFAHLTTIFRFLSEKGFPLQEHQALIWKALESISLNSFKNYSPDYDDLFRFFMFLIEQHINLKPIPLLGDFLYFATPEQWSALFEKQRGLSLRDIKIPILDPNALINFALDANRYQCSQLEFLLFFHDRFMRTGLALHLAQEGRLDINARGDFKKTDNKEKQIRTEEAGLVNIFLLTQEENQLEDLIQLIKLGANVNYQAFDRDMSNCYPLTLAAIKWTDENFNTLLNATNEWSKEQLSQALCFCMREGKFQKALDLIKQKKACVQTNVDLEELLKYIQFRLQDINPPKKGPCSFHPPSSLSEEKKRQIKTKIGDLILLFALQDCQEGLEILRGKKKEFIGEGDNRKRTYEFKINFDDFYVSSELLTCLNSDLIRHEHSTKSIPLLDALRSLDKGEIADQLTRKMRELTLEDNRSDRGFEGDSKPGSSYSMG